METWKKYHYNTKAVVSEMRIESSATVVININGKDNFFKVGYGETRLVPMGANMDKEREIAFDEINAIVDAKVLEIAQTYSKK